MAGPLTGVRIVEFAGLGPTPFAGMLLGDLGADVVRIDRPGRLDTPYDVVVGRNRRSIVLDLKAPAARATALRLMEQADVLIEGFRQGVMERLGLRPEAVQMCNPRLVCARVTGWGQHGPLAPTAGHDINYIALTGVLASIGEQGRCPVPPLTLVGDYAGGGLYLVMGILSALVERHTSGLGQVIDAAMCDGALSMMARYVEMQSAGRWSETRATNITDGGAPYYAVYECADGAYISLGAIEPKFWALFLARAQLSADEFAGRDNTAQWPTLKAKLARVFKQRTRAAWCALFEGSDTCVTPVLTLSEARDDAHLRARQAWVEVGGIQQPVPAPRFSRSWTDRPKAAPRESVSVEEVLATWNSRPSHH